MTDERFMTMASSNAAGLENSKLQFSQIISKGKIEGHWGLKDLFDTEITKKVMAGEKIRMGTWMASFDRPYEDYQVLRLTEGGESYPINFRVEGTCVIEVNSYGSADHSEFAGRI
jgi:hypothetical protein